MRPAEKVKPAEAPPVQPRVVWPAAQAVRAASERSAGPDSATAAARPDRCPVHVVRARLDGLARHRVSGVLAPRPGPGPAPTAVSGQVYDRVVPAKWVARSVRVDPDDGPVAQGFPVDRGAPAGRAAPDVPDGPAAPAGRAALVFRVSPAGQACPGGRAAPVEVPGARPGSGPHAGQSAQASPDAARAAPGAAPVSPDGLAAPACLGALHGVRTVPGSGMGRHAVPHCRVRLARPASFPSPPDPPRKGRTAPESAGSYR